MTGQTGQTGQIVNMDSVNRCFQEYCSTNNLDKLVNLSKYDISQSAIFIGFVSACRNNHIEIVNFMITIYLDDLLHNDAFDIEQRLYIFKIILDNEFLQIADILYTQFLKDILTDEQICNIFNHVCSIKKKQINKNNKLEVFKWLSKNIKNFNINSYIHSDEFATLFKYCDISVAEWFYNSITIDNEVLKVSIINSCQYNSINVVQYLINQYLKYNTQSKNNDSFFFDCVLFSCVNIDALVFNYLISLINLDRQYAEQICIFITNNINTTMCLNHETCYNIIYCMNDKFNISRSVSYKLFIECCKNNKLLPIIEFLYNKYKFDIHENCDEAFRIACDHNCLDIVRYLTDTDIIPITKDIFINVCKNNYTELAYFLCDYDRHYMIHANISRYFIKNKEGKIIYEKEINEENTSSDSNDTTSISENDSVISYYESNEEDNVNIIERSCDSPELYCGGSEEKVDSDKGTEGAQL